MDTTKTFLYKVVESLEILSEKMGLKGEVIKESWFNKMKSKAINTGIKKVSLNFLFEKSEGINYKDYIYLTLKIYGFFYAMNQLRRAISWGFKRFTFNRKMKKVKNRDIRQMFFTNSDHDAWAVVTGCTSGIGLEISRILNENDFNLILISRNQAKLDQLEKLLQSEMDLKENILVKIKADFSKIGDEDLYKKLDSALAEHGIESVDLVFNNVGMGPFGLFSQASLKEIKNQIAVNFKSSLLVTLYFKDLIKRKTKILKSGILYSSSLLGYGELNGFQAYPFAKSMVNLLGNFMAVDFKTRYFTLICTIGQVLTNMNNPLREEYEDYRDIPAKKVPSRFLKAEDCANFMIKNFSYTKLSGGHPDHERMRLNWPIYLPIFRFLMYRANLKKMEENENENN